MKGYTKKPEINCEIGKEKGTFIKWVKVHKKELIFTGISIASLIGITIGIKNRDSIKELWAVLQKNILKVSADTTVIKVTENSIPIIQSVSTTDIISLPVSSEYRTEFDVTGHVRIFTRVGVLPQKSWQQQRNMASNFYQDKHGLRAIPRVL